MPVVDRCASNDDEIGSVQSTHACAFATSFTARLTPSPAVPSPPQNQMPKNGAVSRALPAVMNSYLVPGHT